MATTTIGWGDGSGDNLYLTYPDASGDQTVSVSSDANTGAARSKTVTFTASGVSPVTLTVNQAAGALVPVFYDRLVFDGTALIQTTYVLPNLCSISVPLGNESSKVSQRVFRAEGTNGIVQLGYGGSTNSTRRQMVPLYYSTSGLASNRYLNWTTATYNYFATPKRFGWGSTAYTYTKGSTAPTGGLLLGGGGNQPYTGRMGTFCVYGSDAQNATTYSALTAFTPVATFRPCTYNGVPGMWHVETSTFYGNTAGSGTLSVINL